MRPKFKDRSKVRSRMCISILDSIKDMARELGDGNVSAGIELAVKEYKKTVDSN